MALVPLMKEGKPLIVNNGFTASLMAFVPLMMYVYICWNSFSLTLNGSINDEDHLLSLMVLKAALIALDPLMTRGIDINDNILNEVFH